MVGRECVRRHLVAALAVALATPAVAGNFRVQLSDQDTIVVNAGRDEHRFAATLHRD